MNPASKECEHRLALPIMICAYCLLPVTSQAEEADCSETAQTQVELNSCADKEYAAADAELNRVYQGTLKRYKDDPKFIAKFRESQRAWLKYRDAELDARFPHADEGKSTHYYGSIFPMCASHTRPNSLASVSPSWRSGWMAPRKEMCVQVQ
jgi:uncharacterized protein YecT (DUF1311 family)